MAFNTNPSFFSNSGARLDRLMAEELKGIGADAELAFATHARHGETGNMARNVKAVQRGAAIEIQVHARNPTSGFDYVAVTRFGHRVEFIYPKQRSPATVVATGRKRGRGRRASLRFVIGGRAIFAKRVRGFKPDHDWAEDALPEVQRSTDRAMRRLGRKIELEGL